LRINEDDTYILGPSTI